MEIRQTLKLLTFKFIFLNDLELWYLPQNGQTGGEQADFIPITKPLLQ